MTTTTENKSPTIDRSVVSAVVEEGERAEAARAEALAAAADLIAAAVAAVRPALRHLGTRPLLGAYGERRGNKRAVVISHWDDRFISDPAKASMRGSVLAIREDGALCEYACTGGDDWEVNEIVFDSSSAAVAAGWESAEKYVDHLSTRMAAALGSRDKATAASLERAAKLRAACAALLV